jgi:hypothetical protein
MESTAPPTFTVPVLGSAPVLVSAETRMVALPIPVEGPAIFRKESLEAAFHEAVEDKLAVTTPPSLPIVIDVGLSVCPGRAACPKIARTSDIAQVNRSEMCLKLSELLGLRNWYAVGASANGSPDGSTFRRFSCACLYRPLLGAGMPPEVSGKVLLRFEVEVAERALNFAYGPAGSAIEDVEDVNERLKSPVSREPSSSSLTAYGEFG